MLKYIIKLHRKKSSRLKKNSYLIVVSCNRGRMKGFILDKVGYFVREEDKQLYGLNFKKLSYWLNLGVKVNPRVSYALGFLKANGKFKLN